MKTIGFIGYGKMNRMLARGFLQNNALLPEQVVISTRTREKTGDLVKDFPGVRVMETNCELAGLCDSIIIGVRPLDVPDVIREIREINGGDVHLISIAGCVRISDMSRIHPGRISRFFPSLCATACQGITLCCHDPSVTKEEATYVESLFAAISRVMQVQEDQFEPAGDLMSCAPALITRILTEFASAGKRHSTLSREECIKMVIETAFGTALMLRQGLDPEDLITQVATPGGITEQGIRILQDELPPVFDRLFDTTGCRHAEIREKVHEICGKISPEG